MKIDPTKTYDRKECPACACECAENENRCPICGYLFAGKGGNPLARHTLWIAIILVAVLLFFMLRPLF